MFRGFPIFITPGILKIDRGAPKLYFGGDIFWGKLEMSFLLENLNGVDQIWEYAI